MVLVSAHIRPFIFQDNQVCHSLENLCHGVRVAAETGLILRIIFVFLSRSCALLTKIPKGMTRGGVGCVFAVE